MSKQHYVIVVADDNPEVNTLLSMILEDEGYRVLSCTTGAEALQVAARVQPDLIITDLHMEAQDAGLQLLEQLRAKPETSTIAVIVCSADRLGVIRHAEAWQQYGASILSKPFGIDALLSTVERLVQGAHSGGMV